MTLRRRICWLVFTVLGGVLGWMEVPEASPCRRCPSPRREEVLPIPERRPWEGAGSAVRGPAEAGLGRRAPESHPYQPRRIACEEVLRLAREIAPRHELEPALLVAVSRVESAFVVNALSPVAAVGLSQVMPAVASRLQCGDLFRPEDNLECGARVLKRFLRAFDGDLILALSGYNAGYGMPTAARKEQRPPVNFQYAEDVLRARARLLRTGCGAWDSGGASTRRRH